MSLTYPKTVRGLYLLLCLSSSVVACLNNSYPAVFICLFSILGFVAFDVICYFKDINNKSDKDVLELHNKINEVAKDLNEIKSDHSLAHLAATFKRK